MKGFHSALLFILALNLPNCDSYCPNHGRPRQSRSTTFVLHSSLDHKIRETQVRLAGQRVTLQPIEPDTKKARFNTPELNGIVDDSIQREYARWCHFYEKKIEEKRLKVFSSNLRMAEEYHKTAGTPIELNEYADLTIEEFRKTKFLESTAPTPLKMPGQQTKFKVDIAGVKRRQEITQRENKEEEEALKIKAEQVRLQVVAEEKRKAEEQQKAKGYTQSFLMPDNPLEEKKPYASYSDARSPINGGGSALPSYFMDPVNSTTSASQFSPFSAATAASPVSNPISASTTLFSPTEPKSTFSPFGATTKPAAPASNSGDSLYAPPGAAASAASSDATASSSEPKNSFSPFGSTTGSMASSSEPKNSFSPFGTSSGSTTTSSEPKNSFSPSGTSSRSTTSSSEPNNSFSPFGTSSSSTTTTSSEPKNPFSPVDANSGSKTGSTTSSSEPKNSFSPFGASSGSTTTSSEPKNPFSPFDANSGSTTSPSEPKNSFSPFGANKPVAPASSSSDSLYAPPPAAAPAPVSSDSSTTKPKASFSLKPNESFSAGMTSYMDSIAGVTSSFQKSFLPFGGSSTPDTSTTSSSGGSLYGAASDSRKGTSNGSSSSSGNEEEDTEEEERMLAELLKLKQEAEAKLKADQERLDALLKAEGGVKQEGKPYFATPTGETGKAESTDKQGDDDDDERLLAEALKMKAEAETRLQEERQKLDELIKAESEAKDKLEKASSLPATGADKSSAEPVLGNRGTKMLKKETSDSSGEIRYAQSKEKTSMFGDENKDKKTNDDEPEPNGISKFFSGLFKGSDDSEFDTVTAPTISMWVQDPQGSIIGYVSDSTEFEDGSQIQTTPVKKGKAKPNTVITTLRGTKYKLGPKAPKR